MRAVAFPLGLAAALLAALSCAAAPAPRAGSPAPSAPAPPMPPKFMGSEYVIGSPKAKINLVEYASVACPHCARFDAQVFPALKAKYIDTGKVRYALREMLVGNEDMVQVAAAGFLLARCAGQDRYFHVVEDVYRAQPEIFSSTDPKPIFVRIAKENGLSAQQLDACISDKASIDALNGRTKFAEETGKVDGTPFFVIDGQHLDEHGHEPDLALFDAAFQPLLGPATPTHARRRR